MHELSHGEGFLEILRTRVNQTGFYLMDEPDAPLSFTACLGLAALLHDLVAAGSQLVVATHSPVLAAVPGANVLELGPWGIRPATWEDLSLVVAWRQFMRDPLAFFRHLIEVAGARLLSGGAGVPQVGGLHQDATGTSTVGTWTKAGMAARQASLPLAAW